MNPQKIQGQGSAIKFLGAVWSDETCVFPEAVIDKAQAFPAPNIVNRMPL